MKLVLFGPPGVGKTTIGQVIQSRFGIPFLDGDTDKTSWEKHLLATGQWTDENRRQVIDRIAHHIQQIDQGEGAVIAMALTKQWMRDRLISQVPDTLRFILISSRLNQEAITQLVTNRREREGHPITMEQFHHFTREFESPLFMSHQVIENPHITPDDPQLISQIAETLIKLGCRSPVNRGSL